MNKSTPLTSAKLSKEDCARYLDIIHKGLETSQNKASIVIIGAGVAGLSAALELSKAGHEVQLLEATHRAGGRVYTLREPFSEGLYGEAGAMRYPVSHQLLKSYLDNFNIETKPALNTNTKGFYYFNNQKLRTGMVLQGKNLPPARVMQKWEDSIQPLAKYYFAELEQGVDPWSLIVEQYNEYSLRDFLREARWTEDDIDLFGKMGLGLGGYSSIMGCSFIEIFRLFFVENDVEQYAITEGSDTLINAFLNAHLDHEQPRDKLSDKITYGAKVSKVINLNEKVIVEYENSAGVHRKIADYVICTVPFPVARFIDFHPRLSSGKERAMTELNYFSSTKIFLQTKSRFWLNKQNNTEGLTLTDLPIRSIYFPSQHASCNRGVMIASYTWQKESQLWEGLTEEEKIKKAVSNVSQIFPEIKKEYEVGASISWNDPKLCTGGAFAIYAPGQMNVMYDDIVKSEGRVHFAGDHTSFEHGWVEGAIESGLREAENIHSLVSRQVDLTTDLAVA